MLEKPPNPGSALEPFYHAGSLTPDPKAALDRPRGTPKPHKSVTSLKTTPKSPQGAGPASRIASDANLRPGRGRVGFLIHKALAQGLGRDKVKATLGWLGWSSGLGFLAREGGKREDKTHGERR